MFQRSLQTSGKKLPRTTKLLTFLVKERVPYQKPGGCRGQMQYVSVWCPLAFRIPKGGHTGTGTQSRIWLYLGYQVTALYPQASISMREELKPTDPIIADITGVFALPVYPPKVSLARSPGTESVQPQMACFQLSKPQNACFPSCPCSVDNSGVYSR